MIAAATIRTGIKLTFFDAAVHQLALSALLCSIYQVVLSKLQRKGKFLDELKKWNGNLLRKVKSAAAMSNFVSTALPDGKPRVMNYLGV